MIKFKRNDDKLVIPNGLGNFVTEGTGREPVLEPIVITENGEYTPEEGVDGFDHVTVSVEAPQSEEGQYLYTMDYSDLDYEYAEEWFERRAPIIPGGCSAIRKGDWVGRNLDWRYDNALSFIVRTPHKDGRYATAGVCGGLPSITKEHFEQSGLTEEEEKVLPFMCQDLINEHGLMVEINVVPEAGNTQTNPETIEHRVCALMLVRFLCDYCRDIEDVRALLNTTQIYFPTSLLDMGYESHFMVSDPEESVVIEIINNEIQILDYDKLTNFHLYGVNLGMDNKAYTPLTAVDGHYAHADQGIELYATGLERWNILQDAQIFGKDSCQEVMDSVVFSKAYTGDMEVAWASEFVGNGTYGDITVDTPINDRAFVNRIRDYRIKWQNRSRATGEVWITTHSCVYDLANKTIWIKSQEQPGEQRVILIQTEPVLDSIAITANGTYTPSEGTDGYNEITVNVPQSEPDLQPLTITENGHYDPIPGSDGISDVTVNVAIPPQPVLGTLNVTKNGSYTPGSDLSGWNRVNVNVPTGWNGKCLRTSNDYITISDAVQTILPENGMIDFSFVLFDNPCVRPGAYRNLHALTSDAEDREHFEVFFTPLNDTVLKIEVSARYEDASGWTTIDMSNVSYPLKFNIKFQYYERSKGLGTITYSSAAGMNTVNFDYSTMIEKRPGHAGIIWLGYGEYRDVFAFEYLKVATMTTASTVGPVIHYFVPTNNDMITDLIDGGEFRQREVIGAQSYII